MMIYILYIIWVSKASFVPVIAFDSHSRYRASTTLEFWVWYSYVVTLDGTLTGLMTGTHQWKGWAISRSLEYCVPQRNQSQCDWIRKSSLQVQALHPLSWWPYFWTKTMASPSFTGSEVLLFRTLPQFVVVDSATGCSPGSSAVSL